MNLFQLAWPIFISNILGILLGFIDVFVLSKVSDLAASAIGAACQITSICSLVFSVVCGATGILVAQYLGKKDREKASEITALCRFEWKHDLYHGTSDGKSEGGTGTEGLSG